MNISSEYPASQALALLIQSAIVLVIGLLAARMVRSKGPAWTTMVLRATLATVLVAAAATTVPHPNAHPIVTISVPVNGPSVQWPARTAVNAGLTLNRSKQAAHLSRNPLPAMQAAEPTEPTSVTSSVAKQALSVSARDVLLLLWLSGSAVLLARIAFGQLWLWSCRRRSSARASESVSSILTDLASRQRLPSPTIVVSPNVHSPFVAGIMRPAIYVPESFEATFDSEHIAAILSHELVHIRNRDCLWNLIAQLVCAICWPNPLAWYFARQMSLASEELCDRTVLQEGLQPKSYAKCLMRIAELTTPTRTERCVGVGMIEFRSTLGKRVALVLDSSQRSIVRLSRRARIVTGVAISSAAVATCLAISAYRPILGVNRPGLGADITLPKTDPAAVAYLKSCVDAYANLHSYSARVTAGTGEFDFTTFDVAFKRPHQVFVWVYQKNRLAVDAQILGEKDRFYVTSPNHPKAYVLHERPKEETEPGFGQFPWYRDNSALVAALQFSFIRSGLAESALESGPNWPHYKDDQSITFGPEKQVGGRSIRTLLLQSSFPRGQSSSVELDIDDGDRLVRRQTITNRFPHADDYVTSETYSNVKVNPAIGTIGFQPPADWTRIVAQDGRPARSKEAQLLTSELESALKSSNSVSFVDDELEDQDGAGPVGQHERHLQRMQMKVELEKPLKAHITLSLGDYPRQSMELVADGENIYVTQGTQPTKYLKIPATENMIARMGGMGIPINACQAALDVVGTVFPDGIGGRFDGEIGKPATFDGEPVDELVSTWGGHDRYGFPTPGGGRDTMLVSKEDHLLRQVTRAMGPGRATISENFSDFRLNEPIPSSEFTFDTAGMLGAKAPNEVETRHQELGFNPQLGDVLPDFHSMDLSGKQISLGQFRGKVVLLYGWTFGIGNYQWDLPHFQKLYEQYGKQGLVVIGIPFDGLGDRPQILKYLRSKGITNPQVFDGMGRKAGIQKQYHKLGTIFDYVIDREGHLYAKDPWEKDIDKAVYEALGK